MRQCGRHGRLSAAAAAGSVVLALAACTGGSPAPPASPALPDGVSVQIHQNRPDYAARVLEVSVTNGGGAGFDLVSASFSSPHFADAATWDEALTIAPGVTTDLRVKLADPVCDGESGAPDTVTLIWMPAGRGTDAGAPTATARATVTPRDDTGAIDRISGEDCLMHAVDEVVTIASPALLRVDGVGAASVAWVDLALTPTGGPGTVTIDQVGATLLLASASGLDWPVGVTLAAGSAPLTVSLGLRPTRCDPHAVAEDKRGTVFPIAVATSAGPAGTYNFAVSDALRGQIYDWIAAHCSY